jgi:hypothetical protein
MDGDGEGDSDGDGDGEVLGDGEGEGEGDGEGDGDSEGLGDGEGLGGTLGWTGTLWMASRSNLLTSPIAAKVYAAQICAGKLPPLTRGSPPAPYIGTCRPLSAMDSPKRPTEVTRSGV